VSPTISTRLETRSARPRSPTSTPAVLFGPQIERVGGGGHRASVLRVVGAL